MNEIADNAETAGPLPTLEYRGKYRLSLRIHNDYVHVKAEGALFEFSYNAADATPIALYRVTNAGAGNIYILQPTSLNEAAPYPGSFVGVQGGGEFGAAVLFSASSEATRFVVEFGANNEARFLLQDFNRYMLIAARPPSGPLALFMPPKGSLWDNAWWRLTPYDVWRADMSNADLRQVDLRGRSVVGTNFSGARLKWVSFSGCDLTRADFTGANCEKTYFNGATLNEAKFQRATLTSTFFAGANAWGVRAAGVNFKSAIFRADRFDPPKFGRADLAGAVFESQDLSGVDFRDATLTGASMVDCTLTGADFTLAKMDRFGLERAKCQRAKFDKASMVSARPNAAQLQGASFTKTDVSGADFSSATFDAATDFTEATLHGIEFSNCNLTLPKFSSTPKFYTGDPSETARQAYMRRSTVPVGLLGKDWSMLNLEGATLQGELPTDLSGFIARYTRFPDKMVLTRRKIDSADFESATLIDANLVGVKCSSGNPPNFKAAILRGASMGGMVLPGAIFTDAKLWGANLTASTLVNAKFIGAWLNVEDARSITDLSYCNLRDADFSNAHLDGGGDRTGANFSKVLFYGSNAKISKATLTLATFTGAYLGNLDFKGITGSALRGVNFSNACLVNCDFTLTSLTDCLFDNSCLYGADLTDAELSGAKLSNAWISFNTEPRKLALKGMILQSVDYTKTLYTEDKTNRDTVCPSFRFGTGPCKGVSAWTRDSPAPSEWTYQGRQAKDAGTEN
ncbi:MAG: pentapeptide repeat-containing protein [Tahibacter sp.]